MSLVDDIGHVLSLPHPAGRPFILGGLIAVMLGLLAGLVASTRLASMPPLSLAGR